MRRHCSICGRNDITLINARLAGGAPLRKLVEELGLSRSSLDRHHRLCRCLPEIIQHPSAQRSSHDTQDASPRVARVEREAPAHIDLAAAVEPLRTEALKSRPTTDELLTFSSFLTMQAAKVAVEKGDAIAMVRAAREARNLARFELDTEEQRRRQAECPPQIDRALVLLTAIVGDEEGRAWAARELSLPGDAEDARDN